MGNILLISEDNDTYAKYKNIFTDSGYSFNSCCNNTSVLDLIEIENIDVVVIDENIQSINPSLTIKKIRPKQENTQILLLTDGLNIDETIEKLINGIILKNYSEKMIKSVVDIHLKNKSKTDILSVKNTDLADSLYRLNVLYGTSSQFAGTLDTKKLLEYMSEGLDRALSFDLTCTLYFETDNDPVLIVNSLYDISDELMSALKLRAILNYKALFENDKLPYETDKNNLKIIKNIKSPSNKFTFSIFQYDNMFAPIDLGDKFFGCIEIFKEKPFSTDDATYFQTIVQQVSLPLKSASLYEELKKLERVKSEFLSIGSHELRTPLTPLNNALSILSSGQCGELSESAMNFVNMAKRNVESLTNIVNGILDINKIEAGKEEYSYETISIHTIIENVKNNFESVAKERSINLKANEETDIPNIYADSQKIERVLTNLVSNAIKFTPDGKSITIKSECKNAENIYKNPYFEKELKNLNGNYVVVSVIDEGIGIKNEDMVRTFDKFTQIENSLSRKAGGTGLGLSIAKQLVKAHNGAIWCDSIVNEGSSFHVAIPVYKDNL